MKRQNPGAGVEHHGLLRIVCAFDPDTFSEIRARALATGTSFAEQVRTLCEWGLEAEADVPAPTSTAFKERKA